MKDPKAGPTGREERPIGPPDLDANDLKTCDAAIPTAIAAAPALPELDKAAKAYLDSLHTLQPLTHAAYDYYKREDFEDDGYARGKAMHAPLMEALAAFVQASGVFSTALEAENDRAQQAQLQALEKQEGRTRTYYRLAIMMEAKSLMDLMAEDDFDVVQGRARLDAFNTIADEAHAKVATRSRARWTGTASRPPRRISVARARSASSAWSTRPRTPTSSSACWIRRRMPRRARPGAC